MRTFLLLAALVMVGCSKAPPPPPPKPAPPPPIDEAKAMAALEKLVAAVKERASKPVGMLIQIDQRHLNKVEWGRTEVYWGDVRYETEKTDTLTATIVVLREWRIYEERIGEASFTANFDSVEKAMLAEESHENKEEESVEYVWDGGQWAPDCDQAYFPFSDVHSSIAEQKRKEKEGEYSPFKVVYLYDPANPEELVEVK